MVPPQVFLLCHQLMELSVATFIGVQFRARPLNSVFHQMQEFGLQLVRGASAAARMWVGQKGEEGDGACA